MSENTQKGYTLVRMAELLVAISLLGVLAVQIISWWHNHERESFLKSLKELETLAWQYKENYGKWPAECDSNPVVTTMDQSIQFILNRGSFLDGELDLHCEKASDEWSGEDSALTPERGLTLDNLPDSAKFGVGAISENTLSSQLNSIFAFKVPLDLADWLDREIDGQPANSRGRIRFWNISASNNDVLLGYIIESRI